MTMYTYRKVSVQGVRMILGATQSVPFFLLCIIHLTSLDPVSFAAQEVEIIFDYLTIFDYFSDGGAKFGLSSLHRCCDR